MSATTQPTDVYLLVFDALNENWVAYLHALKACGRRARTRAVHDLRTATRRITADLELVLTILPQCQEAAQLRENIKDELDLLRDLRDHQVEKKHLRSRKSTSRAIRALLTELELAQKREKRVAEKYLGKKVHPRQQTRALTRINEALLGKQRQPIELARARKRALKELLQRFQAFTSAARRARPRIPVSMHQARIRFKKFRYAWEVLVPLLGASQSAREQIKRLQQILGEVQDASVLLSVIDSFTCRHKKSSRDPGIEKLRREVMRQRETAAQRFMEKRGTAEFRELRPSLTSQRRRAALPKKQQRRRTRSTSRRPSLKA